MPCLQSYNMYRVYNTSLAVAHSVTRAYIGPIIDSVVLHVNGPIND